MPGQQAARLEARWLQQVGLCSAQAGQGAHKVSHGRGGSDILGDDGGPLAQQAGRHQGLGQGHFLPCLPCESTLSMSASRQLHQQARAGRALPTLAAMSAPDLTSWCQLLTNWLQGLVEPCVHWVECKLPVTACKLC